MDDALSMRNVSVIRDGRKILDSVDLILPSGESLAVIGPNGAGKSTLLKMLRGDLHPYYDESSPSDFRIFGRTEWDLFELRSEVGTVSMDLQSAFNEETTVAEVILSGFFGSMDVYRDRQVDGDMAAKAAQTAAMMGIGELLSSPIGKISLGEMRRALIARALVTDPKVLVLDEPMTGLDVVMRDRFRKMFDIMVEHGVSIVMITHDLEDIPSAIRRVVAIKEGRIFADGPKEKVLTSPSMTSLFGEPIDVTRSTDGIYHMCLRE
jgi:iron complex transport system ATP-binding protein